MSLKAFHILFIIASTILCFGFGLWGIRAYATGQGGVTELGLGVTSLLLGVALIGYGKYFLKKLKHISYL